MKTKWLSCIILVSLLILTGLVQFSVIRTKCETSDASVGQVYHVDVSRGDDSNDGSMKVPFKTIQKAADIVNPGDTVIVYPGVYYEIVNLVRIGTPEKPITFKAAEIGLHRVTITGANMPIREKKVAWTLEDVALKLYSVPLDYEPSRLLYDDVDLQPYGTLENLKRFELNSGNSGPFLKGADHGFAYDPSTGKLYVRLRADEKYGSTDPNKHIMAVTPQMYEQIKVDDQDKFGYKGDAIGPGSYNFGIVSEKPAHVVLDGFTFETPGFTGVYIRASDLTVRNAWFRGARAGVSGGSKYTGDVFITENVIVENSEYTQFPAYDDSAEIIERYYDDPEVTGNIFFWWQRKGTEDNSYLPGRFDYETGGFVAKVGKNWVIRNNYIHNVFDGISWEGMLAYAISDGGKRHEYGSDGIEIYNNRFEKSMDNAIELENHGKNIRIHHNEFIDNFMPISWQPLNGIPWPTNIKLFKNLIYNSPETGKMWLEKANYGSEWFKAGSKKDQWGWWPWMQNEPWDPLNKIPIGPVTAAEEGFQVFNNTIFIPYAYFLERVMGDAKMKFGNFTFKNNIFVTHSRPEGSKFNGDVPAHTPIQTKTGLQFDHNLYAPSFPDPLAIGTELVANGGVELNNPTKIGFVDMTGYHFELRGDSIARGKGVLITGEPESSTDLGAIPYGTTWKKLVVGPVKGYQ